MAKRGLRVTRDGVAVLRPEYGTKNFVVIGVGYDSIGAVRDANWRDNQCRVPDARYYDENPNWVFANVKVSVTADAAAIEAGIAKRDAGNALRAKGVSSG